MTRSLCINETIIPVLRAMRETVACLGHQKWPCPASEGFRLPVLLVPPPPLLCPPPAPAGSPPFPGAGGPCRCLTGDGGPLHCRQMLLYSQEVGDGYTPCEEDLFVL